MKLHSVNRELAVSQSHDFSLGRFGGDLETFRKRFAANDERMVARGLEWIGQMFENAAAEMAHRRSFSVHQTRGGDDVATENSADALVTKAHPENRRGPSKISHDLIADAGILRPARAGRNADAFRRERLNLREGDRVASFHDYLATQETKILDQVVGKRVVVIDYQDSIHRSPG